MGKKQGEGVEFSVLLEDLVIVASCLVAFLPTVSSPASLQTVQQTQVYISQAH